MKRAIVSLLAVFSILINSCIPIYADEPTVNESNRLIYNIVKLEDMEYVLEGARVNLDFTFKMHIVLEKLNRITNTFEGEFYTSDGYTFSEHIRGSFDGMDLAFDLKNNRGAFRYEFNDATGKFTGANSFEMSLTGFYGVFNGTPYAYRDSLERNRIILDEQQYAKCRNYSADIYNADKKHNYLPRKLEDELKADGFVDIDSRNFRDQYDNNVSYTIAHKKFNYKDIELLDRVIVVIRGTDTYEWLGNMKICPPDSQGNFDKYTFTNIEGTEHANFLQAAHFLEEDLNEYIEYCFGNGTGDGSVSHL